jgi:hypothetical protein
MATSSRQSALFGVNDWKTIYQTFRQADFQSYDYETLRKSFIDYLRLYYPETFNDYTESSEFIALLDVMAFMGQAVSFRNDLNTRENFIDTAERRDSVIKLANLINYNPKRNTAGQGYIKVTGVQTSENIFDVNGINLSNVPVLWNDPANPNWQEQFNTVINASLINSQRVGRPGNSNTILGIKTDEYSINYLPNTTAVLPFTTTVDGIVTNFEIVSSTSLNADYVYEVPPSPNGKFNILYRNDKLGYGSPNTGFFFHFKQGTLQTFDFNLAQQISNQVVDINIQGINETDTWLYDVDTITAAETQWTQVDNVYGTGKTDIQGASRTLFSVTSRFNDQVSYTFGDGVFGEIPVGNYRAYVRAGNALQYVIDPSEMQGISLNMSYVSRIGRVETLTITLDLQLPVTTAQTRETLSDIKERAPQRFYTQNRMVNGEDYNNFPYTLYNAIIKSKAINRTSIGVSRTQDLSDPTGKYSSINVFGSDGALYQKTQDDDVIITVNSRNDIVAFFTDTLANIISGYRSTQYYVQNYTRYDINSVTEGSPIHWELVNVSTTNASGYLAVQGGSPVPVGIASGSNLKYVTPGALIKVTAPGGKYFDSANRLLSGVKPADGRSYFWTTVVSVVGDGQNQGEGALGNGKGPITLNGYVPNSALITQVIPTLSNEFSNEIIQEAIRRIELNQNFSLQFDNSLYITQNRWTLTSYPNSNYFVNFVSLGDNRYTVSTRSLAYYFGSVADTRFTFEGTKVIYDPVTGKSLRDTVSILNTNTLPSSNTPISVTIPLTIIGQTIELDGYPDDYAVEVASTDVNNNTLIGDPDFFSYVTGYSTGTTNTSKFVFFKSVTDSAQITRNVIIPSETINSLYATKLYIEAIKYYYAPNQLFYAYSENKFYKTIADPVTNVFTLYEQTGYTRVTGRQALNFQYKHNSGSTSRVDPGTTNIIDLYLVTQAYYTQYINWVNDSTDTLIEPNRPTINDLNQAFSKINDYKMLSDSVILNSVKFKPLFGNKAAPALRGTIKVIKSTGTTASDSEIRTSVLNVMNSYFSIDVWDFGDTFYFSELAAYIHNQIGNLVSSVVLVPNDPDAKFGDLYEIRSMPYELFVNAALATDIVVIAALTPEELQA